MLKINAAILEEVSKPLVIKEISSSQLKYGQVLVKIFFSGVCRETEDMINGCLTYWAMRLLVK